ncbi:hypothetical protein [Desulforamulus profundi]|uniref:hypothetical protein n=1 Tax=Desulforamulus profundi TaxID=1383067 RepID=UPI001178A239|nr:hypothetical protein [Desulforamulus profundi]
MSKTIPCFVTHHQTARHAAAFKVVRQAKYLRRARNKLDLSVLRIANAVFVVYNNFQGKEAVVQSLHTNFFALFFVTG